ncbi:hypothetical protein Sste5346_007237 [Sporothrix stenoceras]|uniref:Protection of telomeres protein 1 ssDNA-binding domain-containing protein n=1 Tax=Sporothrix stenoceras TaxID=5173 RepID=A0ABR3YVD8_9PEZI
MVVQLTDKSLDTTEDTLSLHIFHPKAEEIPTFRLGDVIVAKGMRVQKAYNSQSFSLLSDYGTAIHIYRAQASSSNKLDRQQWLKHPESYGHKYSHPSSLAVEGAYAAYLHREINKDVLPSIQTFGDGLERSRFVRTKCHELKDVVDFQFYDLFVSVVTEPVHYADSGKTTFWVSDWSINEKFRDFHNEKHGRPGASRNAATDVGDEQGYLTKFGKQKQQQDDKSLAKDWPGPSGRRSMRIECYSPHAELVKEKVTRGSWIKLNNVHVKYFSHTGILEGFLHEDPQFPDVQRVFLYDTTDLERENADERYFAAMRRKKEYKKNVHAMSLKRKMPHDNSALEPSKPLNAKQRRKINRIEAGKTQDADAVVVAPKNRPNPYIHTEYPDRALLPLSHILGPSLFKAPGSNELQLPFANIKFKTQVRVVDFLPHRLVDFAVQRRICQFSILESDGSSSSSSDDDSDIYDSDDGGKVVWEWRFALCLEDASSATPNNNTDNNDTGKSPAPARVWAVIGNYEGQTLFGEDACDLRADKIACDLLREKMFLLWGNLEEIKRGEFRRKVLTTEAASIKTKEAARQREAAEAVARLAEKDLIRKEQEKRKKQERRQQEREQAAINGGNLRQYKQPDGGDSDDGDDADDANNSGSKSAQAQAPIPAMAPENAKRLSDIKKQLATPLLKLSSKPFVCCLQQYGIRNTVYDNGEDATDGQDEESDEPKQVWQPMLSMFGTKIRNSSF